MLNSVEAAEVYCAKKKQMLAVLSEDRIEMWKFILTLHRIRTSVSSLFH